jgi:serine/threonine protein kinase
VLDSRGYIRITDLGIARIYKPHNSCDTSGTPGYMCIIYANSAPEVICRMNHSFVSDYFALGVIAYELMTGRVIIFSYSGPTMVGHEIRYET